VYGHQPVSTRLCYNYTAYYYNSYTAFASSFGRATGGGSRGGSNVAIGRARGGIIICQSWDGMLNGGLDVRGHGIGGWDLSIHHAYDPNGEVLYQGDGGQRSATTVNDVIRTTAGNGTYNFAVTQGALATTASLANPRGVAVGPDGSLYIANTDACRIERVGSDGVMTTVAGISGSCVKGSDGKLATQTSLSSPTAVALGPDGSLYIVESAAQLVLRVRPDGILTTFAGDGTVQGLGSGSIYGAYGDGGPATAAKLSNPGGVTVGPDGSVYIADAGNNRIRRVGPDEIILTVAGTGANGLSVATDVGGAFVVSPAALGDGGPATQAIVVGPVAMAFGPDGSLYIAEAGSTLAFSNQIGDGDRIRRVGPDGIISTVAGDGNWGYSGDGGPARAARLWTPTGIAAGPDGSLHILDQGNRRVRGIAPDGTITTIVGTGGQGDTGDNGPATRATLDYPFGLALGPDGSIYIADAQGNRVRRVSLAFPGLSRTDILIPSEDGHELYLFDGTGRHLRTLDALTNAVCYRFGYDDAGRLATITDADSNVTRIGRDASGNPLSIVAPSGQRTTLTTDPHGYLSAIADPLGQTTTLTVTGGGLLTDLSDPKGNAHHFTYDGDGRLIRDANPLGATTLAHVDGTDGYTVTVTTALGRSTAYVVQRLPVGGIRRVTIGPDGGRTVVDRGTDGSESVTYSDGTLVTSLRGPDPRWEMLAPVLTTLAHTTPGGLTTNVSVTRAVVGVSPSDPLSVRTMTENGIAQRPRVHKRLQRGDAHAGRYHTGRQTVTTLDDHGRAIQVATFGLVPVGLTYDAHGRLTMVAQRARTTNLAYDPQWNVASITDPLSQTTGFAYDAANRPMTQTLADGSSITFAYDANGNRTALTPPGDPAHRFAYTALDQVQTYTPPVAGTDPTATSYSYNADRQLAGVTQPDGSPISLSYDSAGRLQAVTIPRGPITYGYDSASRLRTLTAPDGGTTTYSYDGNLLTTIAVTGSVTGTVGYAYNTDLQVSSETVTGAGTVSDVLALNTEGLRKFRWDRVSIVFQSALNSLNPVITMGEQIIDAILAHERMSRHQAMERAAEMMKLVGIDSRRLKSFPHELSGGMRQRAVIAIALALNPEMVIMDEPTTALDVVVQRDILQQIQDLQQQFGFSILFITHDLSLLVEFSTRIAIMYAGKIAELAAADELFVRPKHPYTVGLMNSFPSITGEKKKLQGIPGSPPDLVTPPPGCRFADRCLHVRPYHRQVEPALREVSAGHQVACHLYEEGNPIASAEL